VTDELNVLVADLVDEQRSLDGLVNAATSEQWLAPTPSVGWCVADQIGHLAYFDRRAATAITEPERFAVDVADLIAGATQFGLDEFTLAPYRALSSHELLDEWSQSRDALEVASVTLDRRQRVPWYGPPMSATSFLGARLMETWAHGTDVANALELALPATDRLRHVARLGYKTRAWSYRVRGETPPEGEIRVDLLGPGGDRWTFGPEDAADTVEGSAEEFCLVVTQRRHVADTSLATTELGYHWLVRAQAFAGAPSDGPRPRSG